MFTLKEFIIFLQNIMNNLKFLKKSKENFSNISFSLSFPHYNFQITECLQRNTTFSHSYLELNDIVFYFKKAKKTTKTRQNITKMRHKMTKNETDDTKQNRNETKSRRGTKRQKNGQTRHIKARNKTTKAIHKQ